MYLAGQNLHHPGRAVNPGASRTLQPFSACTRMVHDLSIERTYIILVQLRTPARAGHFNHSELVPGWCMTVSIERTYIIASLVGFAHAGTTVNSGACSRMVHDLSKERTYIILVQL
jgi:hypothetical protein